MNDHETRFKAILSVYLVLVNDKDEALLLKRQNTGFADGQYGLPAGHIDGNETVIDGMRREAKEEAGIDIESENLDLKYVLHRNCGDHERVDFFFWCNKWNGEVSNVEPHKCSDLAWFPLSDLPENVIDYYRQMFDDVRNGKMYGEFGWKL